MEVLWGESVCVCVVGGVRSECVCVGVEGRDKYMRCECV